MRHPAQSSRDDSPSRCRLQATASSRRAACACGATPQLSIRAYAQLADKLGDQYYLAVATKEHTYSPESQFHSRCAVFCQRITPAEGGSVRVLKDDELKEVINMQMQRM